MEVNRYVFDASGMVAYIDKEPGHEAVIEILDEASRGIVKIAMCWLNWGEVHYQLLRVLGMSRAQEIFTLIQSYPIEFFDADKDLTLQAAHYKANKKLPYVDSVAAALAKSQNAMLLTTDQDFKLVQDEIKIKWLR